MPQSIEPFAGLLRVERLPIGWLNFALVWVIAVVGSGCAHYPGTAEPARTASIEHVVLVWLVNPGDTSARIRVIEASSQLQQIPGVLAVRAGPPVHALRPIVDDSFDVGVVITFENEAALRAYDAHPLHQKLLAEVLRPLSRRTLVYDFAVQNP